MKTRSIPLLCAAILILAVIIGCDDSDSTGSSAGQSESSSLSSKVLGNRAPYIPAQCYTKTEGEAERVHNTCYTCHTTGFRPDFINDDDLQLEYAFPGYADKNHWENLFADWESRIAGISDSEILSYIRTSNYMDAEGRIIPADHLKEVPDSWDYDQDGEWSGYVPDCYFHFDEEGFDRDPSGGYTGWRAYAYYPFPTVHWPSAGSMGDVLIRLPDKFRTMNGRFDKEVYRLNLAILEAVIKKEDVSIPLTDEGRYNVDLDRSGAIGSADRVSYDWKPLQGVYMFYVGDAKEAQEMDEIHLAAGLFPEGTEFLNTLRYIDTPDAGGIGMAARMKEIRYAKKTKWLTYAELETLALDEVKERVDFPDRLSQLRGNIEDGVPNGIGWVYQGFIEAEDGALRPQTFEEAASCIGCHGGVGATTDGIFSMQRKLDAQSYQEGWFHWSQKSLEGINEPKVEFDNAGVQYEYAFFLMYAGGADDLRANQEAYDRFFNADGSVKKEMVEALHDDISVLLCPSRERALSLNKGYRRIVEDQSYTLGRDVVIGASENIHEEIEAEERETKVSQAVVLDCPAKDFSCPDCPRAAGEPMPADFRAEVDGNGMDGPDGKFYEMSWEGIIDKSTYAIDTEGFYFPFPPRHTLPSRFIVPNGTSESCYECHRLSSPMPPDAAKSQGVVDLPPTLSGETGLSLTRLTDDSGKDMTGMWSPDGEKIAWVSDRSGSYQIWVMNRDGSQKMQLTQGPRIHGWPEWRPDGSRLVYWGYDGQTGVSYVSSIGVDGLNEITVVESPGALDKPVYSPDGEYIAYAGEKEGNWDIWVAEAEGAGIYRLTDDPQMETNPLWRPDGRALAYKACASGDYGLCGEEFLTFADGFENPHIYRWNGPQSIQMYDWSPDGQMITYTAEIVTNASGEDRVSYLALADAIALQAGGTTNQADVLSNGATLGDRGPVFSPDGTRIAFWSWDKSYRATLWLVDADGSNLRQLTSRGFDMYPRWHRDGESLLFESNRSGNLDLWTAVVE